MKLFNLLCLFLFSIPVLTQAQVSLETLKTVVAAFHAEYDQELASTKSRFIVNPAPTPAQPDFWWSLHDIRAAYAALYDKDTKILTHYLYLLGGYGKLASEVNKDPYFYPSSQCRLDTMMAGLFEKERLRCWYLP